MNSATALSPHDAIRKVLDLSGESSDHGTITALWREHQESRTWKELAKRTAPVRANREIAVLSNLMELAIRRGMLDVNPCRQIRRNKEKPGSRDVRPDELQAFLAWCQGQGERRIVLAAMADFARLLEAEGRSF
ncbi:MAG: hypothetical protein ACYDCF_02605 [Burkholderiales bacterium]